MVSSRTRHRTWPTSTLQSGISNCEDVFGPLKLLRHLYVTRSGKKLPCPNVGEIWRLARLDIGIEDEPALFFECGEAEHMMLSYALL